jgi:hypothetical protein
MRYDSFAAKVSGRTYSQMRINDWYLDRQGRGESPGDDDRPDQGPDTWLDRFTGPSAPRGRRAVVGADRRRSSGAPAKAPGWRREPTLQSASSPRPARTRQLPTAASDQALAREAARMQQQSSQSLSYADVVRRLQTAGWRVTKADLQRAIRATNTEWGKPSRNSKGEPGNARAGSRRPPSTQARISDPTICEACGVAVSANGYCRCS